MSAKDDWSFNWDLKSGYHHVNIYKSHQQYLGFSWVIDGVQRCFVFRVLPFGLATACFCFTKLLRLFALRWQSIGHNCFIYINDGISGHLTKQLACIAGHRQKSDLTRAGFIFSEKCNWEPHQIGVWLGLIIDTIRFEFRIPQEKLDKLYAKLDEIIESRFASFRFTAKLEGFLQSLHLAVGPVIRLFTRQMHFAIATRTYWDEKFLISEPLQDELKFWRHNLNAFNGYSIRKNSPLIMSFSQTLAVSVIRVTTTIQICQMLMVYGLKVITTFRELKAIYNVVECYAPQIAHCKVKIYSDNQGACSIME